MIDKAELRAAQEAAVARVEAAIERGDAEIWVEGRAIRPEPAWAATKALRTAWALEGATYDGQECAEDGEWFAKVEVGGELRRISIGRFADRSTSTRPA